MGLIIYFALLTAIMGALTAIERSRNRACDDLPGESTEPGWILG